MHYMLIIFSNDSDWAACNEAQQAEVMAAHGRLEQDLRSAGKYRGCGGLQPTSTATVVRVRDGKTLISDGPFAETKEQVGGYYLVEADNLDEAIGYAARIPMVGSCAVEVRPIHDLRL